MPLRDQDESIRSTNIEATSCRYSMVNMGYMEDPYVRYFINQEVWPNLRKPPIIHRGTYARCKSIDDAVEWFVKRAENFGRGQIISLGAGFDTRYFRLKVCR